MSKFYSPLVSSSKELKIDTSPSEITYKKISFKKTLIRGDLKKYFKNVKDYLDARKVLQTNHPENLKTKDQAIKKIEKEKEEKILKAREAGQDTEPIKKKYNRDIEKAKENKETYIKEYKETLSNLNKTSTEHRVFHITGDQLTLEVNEKNSDGKIITKKYTTQGMQHEIVRRLENKDGHGLYNRFYKNNSSYNDAELIRQNREIVCDICFKFKEEKKSLMNRLLMSSNKEEIEKKSEDRFVYILIPVYNSLRSNLNGNQFDLVLQAQKNRDNSTIVDFSNFIDYNKPYITYNFITANDENEVIEKSNVIVMMTSNIHVSYPSMDNFLSLMGTATPKNVQINTTGFYNENAESPEMSCQPIYEDGSMMIEKNSKLADDGKILNFEQQLEALSKTTPGQIILGLLLILIGYLFIYATIKGLYDGPADILARMRKRGFTGFSGPSLKVPMNAAKIKK